MLNSPTPLEGLESALSSPSTLGELFPVAVCETTVPFVVTDADAPGRNTGLASFDSSLEPSFGYTQAISRLVQPLHTGLASLHWNLSAWKAFHIS